MNILSRDNVQFTVDNRKQIYLIKLIMLWNYVGKVLRCFYGRPVECVINKTKTFSETVGLMMLC